LHTKLANGDVRDINDLITLNLDIVQFAQDVLRNCDRPELLRAFWRALEKISVLDPTVGSGAFLFAALNILKPLYEACLERMEAFVGDLDRSGEKHRPEKFSDFRAVLARVGAHPNADYFILKAIILNNLYGVDIMEEATEICKLRLFLKLAAQVEPDPAKDNFGIEPLPDIDFNIRAGNTLVGYATADEVRRAFKEEAGGQGKLLLGESSSAYKRFEENVELADRAFRQFREMQTERGMDSSQFASAKVTLRKQMKALEDELNKYLASDYGVKVSDKTAYSQWLNTHSPFHWFIEFYGIVNGGGFDVTIGNPPFVEHTPSKVTYRLKAQTYSTLDCGNLYAFVSERCFSLSHGLGSFSFIMPSASLCTPRMATLLTAIQKRYGNMWTSIWDERPSKLFDGVDQQLAIHVCRLTGPAKRPWITPMRHWAAEERTHLFSTISYARLNDNQRLAEVLPKIGTELEQRLLTKIHAVPHLLSGTLMVKTGGARIYYRNAGGRYWRLVKSFPTHFRSEAGASATSTEKIMSVAKEHVYVCVALFSSSLFYWFWRVCSNCRHLTDRELMVFPVAKEVLTVAASKELQKLGEAFEERISETKDRLVTENLRSGRVVQDVFFVSTAKDIIDGIDRALAKHYGFDEEELEFVLSYDSKYRLGAGNGDSAE